MKSKLEYHHCYEGSCFICLQHSQTNQETNSLNFLFSYLEIGDKLKGVLCEKCDKNLTRLEKLCETLKKISLEMDYLLDYIQSSIHNSKKDFGGPVECSYVREAVMRKCRKEMLNPKPEILLKRVDTSKAFSTKRAYYPLNLEKDVFQRDQEGGRQVKRPKAQISLQKIDISKLIQTESQTLSSDCSGDLDLNWTDSNSSFFCHPDEPAVPVIKEISSIKSEVLQGSPNHQECLQKPSDYCQTPGYDKMNFHGQTQVNRRKANHPDFKAQKPDFDRYPNQAKKGPLDFIQAKHLRIKEQNRRAAHRLRKKKQDTVAVKLKEVERLEALNEKLTIEKVKLETEIKIVRTLLRDKLWKRTQSNPSTPFPILPN